MSRPQPPRPAAPAPRPASSAPTAPGSLPLRREGEYVPRQQSMQPLEGTPKGRDRDEEAKPFEAKKNEEFKDEDRLTNKTGDPRIGTHSRKWEP